MTTAATKTYAYTVVRSQGMYDSGDVVPVARLTDDLEAARKFAQRCSDDYRRGMRQYGGSSGGYRVIPWGSAERTISGYALDRTPDAK